jgi:hypothetical protein
MRGTPRDRSGDRYGNLTVISRAGANRHGQTTWECKCDCGATVTKSVVFFNNGGQQCSKSCSLGVHVKHGATTHTHKSKEYGAWIDMKQRCLNPSTKNYARYGGRGITVHQPWVDSFEAFLADVGIAPQTYRASLDRINNDGNYEPSNVRWSTPKEQTRNRRVTMKVTVAGEDMPLSEAAERWGINYYTVLARYHKGFRGGDLIIPHKTGRKPKK